MKFKKLLNGFREIDWYNGKTLSKGHWKNGNKIGYWEWFTPSGDLNHKEFYL